MENKIFILVLWLILLIYFVSAFPNDYFYANRPGPSYAYGLNSGQENNLDGNIPYYGPGGNNRFDPTFAPGGNNRFGPTFAPGDNPYGSNYGPGSSYPTLGPQYGGENESMYSASDRSGYGLLEPGGYPQSGRSGYSSGYGNSNGIHSLPRPPFDLTIPSWLYVPEKYTGHMQYLPNQPIYAAEGVGPYVGLFTLYQAIAQRSVQPTEPSFDPIFADPVAYIDGHPVTQSPAAAAASALRDRLKTKSNKKTVALTSATNNDDKDLATKFKTCVSRHSSGATIQFGVCVPNVNVTKSCAGKAVLKMLTCGKKASCCLSHSPDSSTSLNSTDSFATLTSDDISEEQNVTVQQVVLPTQLVVPPALLSKTCRSKRNSLEFGLCTSNDLIITGCENKFVAPSDDCEITESCCLTNRNLGNQPVTSQATVRCASPIPPFNLGFCVNNKEVSVSCVGLFITKSSLCQSTQSCCVKDSSDKILSLSTVQNSPKTNTTVPLRRKIFRNTGNLRRIRNRCVSIKSTNPGNCVASTTVTETCSGKILAHSPDCRNDEFCCVDVSLIQLPLIRTRHFGNQLKPGMLINNPASRSDGFVSCQTTATNIPFGICVEQNVVLQICPGKTILKSSDCSFSQLCCFENGMMESSLRSPSTDIQSSVCSANSQHSSACIPDSSVSSFCIDKLIIKSSSCSFGQTCCMDVTDAQTDGSSVTATTVTATTSPMPLQVQQCSPMINNFQLGICVDENQVTSLCAGRTVAPSTDCAFRQSCCSNILEAQEIPVRNIIAPVTTTAITTITSTVKETENFEVSDEDFLRPCIANDRVIKQMSSVRFGVCVKQDSAMDYCVDKIVSESDDCKYGQLCCTDQDQK